ncbi:MAG: tetrahydrofolate synthase [Treponema sp.]|jgi:dihydrofolate synthase/folylpolyglutamate synthase|nr:tetrahydrofolate synthase [Treponema sp.]
MFSLSSSVFEWISRFINFERIRADKGFCLDRMWELAENAGHPERTAPVIHVAGSKGKGSVSTMIASILSSAGFKTALYTSPHVLDFRERITWNGDFFAESVYVDAGNELFSITEKTFEQSADAPTFFELFTLFFFLCARQADCTAMVVETGMGGRLDATNIVFPCVSIITLIEKEHTEYLGDTITLIAKEKSGIIKPGIPLVLAEQAPEARAVFYDAVEKARCQACSPLKKKEYSSTTVRYFPDEAEIKDIIVSQNGTDFILVSELFPDPLALSLPIPGTVQAKNAGLAVLAVKTVFPAISAECISTGLRKCRPRARFERILDTPPVIVDGAHTCASIDYCADTFTSIYGDGVLLFGCAASKDVLSMAKILTSCFSIIIVTAPGTFKESYPEKVFEVFKSINPEKVLLIKNTAVAIDKTLAIAYEKSLPVLATGSFYLAGEVIRRLSS